MRYHTQHGSGLSCLIAFQLGIIVASLSSLASMQSQVSQHCLTVRTGCRLDLAESIRVPNRGGPRRNPFEAAMAEAERQEAQHGPPEELPFTATILCVGIGGTGKSATIHNLLGRPAPSNFAEGTKKVRFCKSIPAELAYQLWH